MAQETKHTRYGKPIVGAVDLHDSDPELAIYRCMPSAAARAGLLSDDPIPLFLSGPPSEAQQPGSGKAWRDSVISPRMLRAGILAAIAAAIGFAVIPVENRLAVLANAKASLIGASAAQPSVAPTKSAAGPAASSATADPSTPTRDEIAGALRAALQSQTEIRSPPATALPARRIDADELAALLKRARSLIVIGDIAAARLLLERAADAQAPSAALLLAQTYDPAVLGTPDTRSITPDPAAARGWYQKAARFGSLEAQQRLDQMKN
jgi:TPR repeat protein